MAQYNWSSGQYELLHTRIYEYHNDSVAYFDGKSWGTLVLDVYLADDDTIGLIAVDSAKVYYHSLIQHGLFDFTDTTIVLYDFHLAIGDTAYVDLAFGGGMGVGSPMTVLDTGTYTLSGRSRRYFATDYGDTLREGVGSDKGLLRPFFSEFESDFKMGFCGEYIDSLGIPYDTCIFNGGPELRASRLLVFPNPASNEFYIAGNRTADRYDIFDPSGRPVLRGALNQEVTRIGTEALSPGLYLLAIDGTSARLVIAPK